ncbi:beta-lactamase family protein [Polaribacter litorisediminis]|nr:beta-lactamase family protein [Polaribacter litorisediminis]
MEDDIRIYLKGDYSNLEYNDKPIIIKNLLTHTSGLPMFLPLHMNGVFEKLNESVPEVYLELEKSYAKEKFLEDLKTISIKTEPGTNYSYSNAGAELIGYILETVYQKSIDELLKESFSSKYEMINT